MLWTSSVIYLVTPLLWLVKTPADMNELRDLHSSALILIASKIIMAMLVIRRGFRTLVLHYIIGFHVCVRLSETEGQRKQFDFEPNYAVSLPTERQKLE